MPTDQIETLTHERQDARHIINDLPVENLADLMARDDQQSGSPIVKIVMTTMAWATYIMALGVMLLLTKAILGR